MRKILLLAIIFVTVSASGCAIIGRDRDFRSFDPKALSSVTPGKSTAGQVTQLFGAPTQVVKLSNGNAYMYTRSTSKGTVVWLILVTFANYDRQYDQVVFFFDKNDVLTHHGTSLKAAEAAYGMPF
jgi:outer membrane protein assembly factor BamE (lipoprotein component of BamABCDE complex)